MFQFTRRNTGENATPSTSDPQPQSTVSNVAAPNRRLTLEQIMFSLGEGASTQGPAQPTPASRAPVSAPFVPVQPVDQGQMPNGKTSCDSAARPPAWKATGSVSLPATPLGYKAPASAASKLVPSAPMEWRTGAARLVPEPAHPLTRVASGQSADIPVQPVTPPSPLRLPGQSPSFAGNSSPELRKPTPDDLLPDLVRTAEHQHPAEIGALLPLELIYALRAHADQVSIHQKLQQYCKRECHNPLLELPSGTVAFVSLEDCGKIRVFIGNMRDFSLFCVRTNMLDGTLPLEEMYEYEETCGKVVVTHKRANEIGPGQIAGRKMYPVLQFMSYTAPGYGKATYQIKSEWR